eukprot:TRINITY_DN306_c0_g1_i8.p2 TRINITY_DN306_c0_g1~~TRINITY_DN306_c0_g1_i8.p2  ORF type:complete len:127 (-),score=3.62 TRINITY_DN306_c0_g1_i8:183-563(-)
MSVFLGLQKMGQFCPLWSQGGYSWFVDLNALDTTYQLPGMAGLALLVTVLTIPVDTANPAGSILASKVYGVPVAKLAMGGGMAALLTVFGAWMPAGASLRVRVRVSKPFHIYFQFRWCLNPILAKL